MCIRDSLYILISDNTPVFTPRPNKDEITSCMDIIADWIAERHPLDSRRMELFKLLKEQGESMVQYLNRILDIADECDSTVPEGAATTWRWGNVAVHQERSPRVGQISEMRGTKQ